MSGLLRSGNKAQTAVFEVSAVYLAAVVVFGFVLFKAWGPLTNYIATSVLAAAVAFLFSS